MRPVRQHLGTQHRNTVRKSQGINSTGGVEGNCMVVSRGESSLSMQTVFLVSCCFVKRFWRRTKNPSLCNTGLAASVYKHLIPNTEWLPSHGWWRGGLGCHTWVNTERTVNVLCFITVTSSEATEWIKFWWHSFHLLKWFRKTNPNSSWSQLIKCDSLLLLCILLLESDYWSDVSIILISPP